MLNILFKKSLKSKVFLFTFIIFSLLSGGFVGFPLMVSLSNGFTTSMINNVMWAMMFCVFLIVLIILLIILKSIIFDNDMNFLIKVELQYKIKQRTIYFIRYFILTIFAFIYITFILICYFIYTIILVEPHMNYSIFLNGTIGYIAYLYLFTFAILSILFLTSFIKNNGLKFSIPFIVGLIFSAITINSQFFLVPNRDNSYSYQSFAALEKDFLNYQKFEASDFKKLYDKINKENLTNDIEKIFSYNKNQNLTKYNVFYRPHFFSSQPKEINYNKNNRSISDIFNDLANNSKNFYNFYKFLAVNFQDFELNNMFNINLLQSDSDYNIGNYYGFLNMEDYQVEVAQKPISADAFLAERFINLANQYAGPINRKKIDQFKNYYDGFKNETKVIAYGFFWEQPGYLLSGNMYNVNNDIDRSLSYMAISPMQRLINYNFKKTDENNYIISNQKIERAYSYEVLLIEYIIAIVILNFGAYILFSKKINQ